MCQIIYHHFGRSKDFFTSPVTALEHLKDGMIGLGRVVALRNSFMSVRIKRLTDALLALDAVLAEQQAQLLQRHLHTLMKLARTRGCTGSQSTVEVVYCGQQFTDERFLLRDRTGLAFLTTAPLEILEVGGQAQIQVFLLDEFLAERVRLCGSSLGEENVGV